MFSRRRSLFDFSRNRLAKAPRREKRRARKSSHRGGGLSTRLSVETLEDRYVLSATIGLNFLGSTQGVDSGSIPPDTNGAAGPNHFVELINGRYSVYDKLTGSRVQTSSLNQFWTDSGLAAPDVSSSFDPRVIYDHDSQLWFATSVDNRRDALSNIQLAVSTSLDPTQGWIGLSIDADPADDRWADFPQMGIDAQGVYLSTIMFDIPDVGADNGTTTSLYSIPKADLIDGTPSLTNLSAFRDLDASTVGFRPYPVIDFGPDDGSSPFLATADIGDDVVRRTDVTGAGGAGAVLGATTNIDVVDFDPPNDVDQPGPKQDINTGDSRFSGAVYEVGNSIWGAYTVEIAGRNAIRWHEIDETTNAVLQTGTISDPVLEYFYPSIAANAFGDVVIGFSGASTAQFVSAYVAVGETTAGVTTFETPLLSAAGVADYENLDSAMPPRNRWGDYSATSVDPADPRVFWTTQEFVSATDVWSTQITQIIVGIEPDELEDNDSLATASVLGSPPFLTLNDLTIDDASDEDWFRYTAHHTGKLIVNAIFDDSPGDGFGDLDLRIVDSAGNVIASSTTTDSNEQIVIPVVSQEQYFVQVLGVGDQINDYDLEIENFAAPAPAFVDLSPVSDTGADNSDDVTSDTTPTFLVQADLVDFRDMGIDLLNRVTIDPNNDGDAADATDDGAGVFVTAINIDDGMTVEGFANQVGTAGFLWSFTPTTPLTDGQYFVSAAVQIVDGQQDPNRENGRAQLSDPLFITILSNNAAANVSADLLAASDTGMFNDDNVTSIRSPAIQGIAPAGSTVRLFANGELVGQTTAGSDSSDVIIGPIGGIGGAPDDGLGLWEITTEPLADGAYDLRIEVEDAAGNVFAFDPNLSGIDGEPIDIVIDTEAPNTPLLDLRDDTGEDLHDEITNDNTPTVFMTTTDPNIAFAQELFTDNLKFRLFDRFENNAEVLIYDSAADAAADNVTTAGDMFTSLTALTRTLPIGGGVLADGTHNLKLEVEDRAGNISHDFLLEVIVDSTPPVAPTPNLLDSSDSGMFNDDNVTNIQEAAFDGVAEVNTKVTVFAQAVDPTTNLPTGNIQQIGSSTVGSDATDGVLGNGEGSWEVTVEPLADGAWDITTRIEDWAGNLSDPSDALRIVVDTEAPNTPLLDLLDDTGRSDVDNITKDNQPQVFMTTTDPNVQFSEVLFTDNFKFRLFDRFEATPETLIYDSANDVVADNTTTAGDMFTSLTALTRTIPSVIGTLADGVHNLKLEVEDRAGNISHDFLLEIIVDTVNPDISFGLPNAVDAEDGLAADSDSGVTTDPATFGDRITNDTTPRLWGRAEANTVVSVYHDDDGNGVINLATDTFLGQTVAVPLDGNDAFVDANGDPLGFWELETVLDLNEIIGIPKDGIRNLLVSAEDVAGNPMPMGAQIDSLDALDIFIDTQGPQVNEITVNDLAAADYDLFDPKPSENGPTPLVNQLVIDFIDQPPRALPFVYEALQQEIALAPGNYLLVGDHVGTIPIQTVAITASSIGDGAASSTTVTLTFFEPLPDDRFTLTISDNLVDPAGNNLDGESNADEPQEDPIFPSGDGVPGGDFIGRFTIDARPELGSFVAQDITLDINGNFVWDPANGQIGNDATNVDLTFRMNVADPATGAILPGGYGVHDLVFAGKFSPLGQLIVGDDAVFIVDVSGSTDGAFGGDPVGDQNNDGLFNTILDAEIAAFKLLNQELIDRGLGNTSQVSIVAFESTATSLDMDPVAAGVQLTTTPLADSNGNGMRDIDELLMGLTDGGGTNYEAALAEAATPVAAIGNPDVNVIFLSDGAPNNNDIHADEAATLEALGVNLRAFGVGPAVPLDQLQIIDAGAVTFSNTNELLAAFGGLGGGAAGDPSGFDQLAVYGWSQDFGIDRWLIDTNSDGVINTGEGDIFTLQPVVAGFDVVGAVPIAGNFDGDLNNGDEIGLYNAGQWALDTNRDFVIDAADTFIVGDLLGHPIVGDFDGNGDDDLGVFNNNTWNFDLNAAGFDGNSDDALIWGFPGVLDRPIAVDFDQDGIDDIGMWVPRNSAQLPRPGAEWFILISADPTGANRITGQINTLDHPFEPIPFGNDLYAEFGDELALPVVGNFDPPVVAEVTTPGPDNQSFKDSADFDQDGDIDGSDFLAWQRGYGKTAYNEPGMDDGDGNHDNQVDHQDLALWTGQIAAIAAASSDFNGDGSVDGHDLAMWQGNFYAASAIGDATGDGFVSGSDFLRWQRSASTSPTVALAASTAPTSTPSTIDSALAASATAYRDLYAPAARAAAFDAFDESSSVDLLENDDQALAAVALGSPAVATNSGDTESSAAAFRELAFSLDDGDESDEESLELF